MHVRLIVTVHLEDDQTKEYDYAFQQDEITLGRHSSNDIQIPDPRVSTEHAKITVGPDGAHRLEDLGSQLGTLLDGEPAPERTPVELRPGATIGIANYSIQFSPDAGEVSEEVAEKTQMVAMRMVREVLNALGATSQSPYLEVLNDDEQGETIELPDESTEVVIGRTIECDLQLTHWSISRQHARVVRSSQGITVEDLGSKNRVMINEVQIEPNVPEPLQDGDVIFIAHTQLRFRDPSDSAIDSLDDIPTPVPLDIKTSGITLGDTTSTNLKKAKEAVRAAKAEAAAASDETGAAGEAEPAPADASPAAEKKKPRKEKPPKPAAAAPAPPTGGGGGGSHLDLDDIHGGGLGDSLYLIIGIIVLVLAVAAVFVFVL